MTRTRYVTFLLAAAITALAAACCPPAPAPPDPLLSCDTFTVSVTYTPPATTTAGDVAGTIDSGSGVSGCTDATGRGVVGAELTGDVQATGACSSHGPSDAWVRGTGQLAWSDGSSSTWSAELLGGTVLRADLTITDGLWVGATASLELAVVGVVGNCGTSGLVGVALRGGPFVLHPAGAAAKPLSGVQQLSAGGSHTCAVVGTGAKCWGANDVGQLGTGVSGPGHAFDAVVPVDVVGLGPVSQISAGERHTCALLADGTARCWGVNDVGQLGNGPTGTSNLPVDVIGLTGATDISASDRATCAVVSGGGVSCWGGGTFVPTPVAGISGASAVSVGGSYPTPHACALLSGGSIVCWGDNSSGQLGDGTTVSSTTPVPVTGISGASAVVAGPYGSTCAVVGGVVQCWGANGNGQLGNGSTTGSSVPVPVSGLSDVTDVGLGAVHTCATLADGSARCWGNNNYGQLGAGPIPATTTPVDVAGLTDATAIAVGHYSTCARRSDGTAACWGLNANGQLGTGFHGDASTPMAVVAAH